MSESRAAQSKQDASQDEKQQALEKRKERLLQRQLSFTADAKSVPPTNGMVASSCKQTADRFDLKPLGGNPTANQLASQSASKLDVKPLGGNQLASQSASKLPPNK
jgi:hypothetical protein